MTVGEIMSGDVAACVEADTLAEAARRMEQADCGCVPVTASDGSRRVVGIVTDRDICLAGLRADKPFSELRVGDAMTADVRTCSADASPHEAEYVMREARVRRLPVVDEQGALVGLLSLTDLAREAQREHRLRQQEVSTLDLGATLVAICRTR